MTAIIPPIKPGDTGAPVANLQDALVFLAAPKRKIIQALDSPKHPTAQELKLLTAGLRKERKTSKFGNSTRQLVRYFQVQRDLGDNLNGEVEEKTAAKLNELLKSFGALDQANLLRVHGTVTTFDNKPIKHASVKAFDQDLRKEQPLGDANTDSLGKYVIPYGREKFQAGDVPSASVPKLIVRAYDSKGQQIGNDVIPAKPSRDQEVNFKTRAPVISEWEKLSAGVKPLLAGQGKGDQDLPEEELTSKDLDFIAEETGLDRAKLRFWALAFSVGRSAAGGGIAPEIFYGWFRLGLPTAAGALWSTSTEKLMATLTSAIEQAIVPSGLAENPAALTKLLEQIKLDRALQAPTPNLSAPLGDLLTTLPRKLKLNPDQQRAIADSIANLRPSDPQLLGQLKKIPGFHGNAAGVARTLRLGALTSGHLPLIADLQKRLVAAKEAEGTLKPLAALRPDEWLDLAYTHGTPAGVSSDPAAYANALSVAVEQQYPHAALIAHFTQERRLALHPALAEVATFLGANQDFDIVAANINAVKSKSKLDAVKQPDQLVAGLRSLQRLNTIGANWDETAGLMENDIYSPAQVLDAGPTRLASLLDGRIPLARINALHSQAKNLHDVTLGAITAGFAPLSAPQIFPERAFLSNSSTAQPDSLEAHLTLALSSRHKSLTLNGFTVAKIKTTSTSGPAGNVAGSVLEDQPTLQASFGSQDACACGHCNSVLGPAAYFVDLLQFIEKAGLLDQLLLGAVDTAGHRPGRRPDLQDIELSCNNTNTEVPSIDLALEILENAVALPLPVALPPGTTIAQQLPSPASPGDAVEVGNEIKKALLRTVRSLPKDVRGTRQQTKDGTEWTIVDGHRRWKLTAQEVDDLLVKRGVAPSRTLDISGQNLTRLIEGLDSKSWPLGSEPVKAQLVAPNQTRLPSLANYTLTIEPLKTGESWSVQASFETQLTINDATNEHVLSTPGGEVWSKIGYNPKTIAAVKEDLVNNRLPILTHKLIASQFPGTRELRLKAAGSARWSITATLPAAVLTRRHTQVTITSLAYQSGDPDADAIAEPENHNPEAYLRLKGERVVFPWSLPVDLPLEEVRLFLERARCSRRRLIELLASDEQALSGSAVFAAEVLRLSSAEATLIVEERTAQAVYDCWGVPADPASIFDAALGQTVTRGGPLELLRNVSILLQQSRLRFVELQAMLATKFVQKDSDKPLVIHPADTCQPSEMTLPALTDGHLDRLHRFTRLGRNLGWSVRELDSAIQALGGVDEALLPAWKPFDLAPDTLRGLAQLHRLSRQLDLPVPVLVGGLSLLESQPWTEYLDSGPMVHASLYSTIFQRETLRSAKDFAVFSSPGHLAGKISKYAAYVGACLGLKSSVVRIWLADKNALGIEDKLTLGNLSRLTSAGGLCRGLALDPEKLTICFELYGVSLSPFKAKMDAAARANATLQFARWFQLVRQSGAAVETLHYLFRLPHETTFGPIADIDEKQLADLSKAALAAAQSLLAPIPPLAPDHPQSVAFRVARENAVIASLATGLGAARELVDDLMRLGLQNPSSDVFFRADDFLDPQGLRAKLQTNEPVSSHLWNRFSTGDQKIVNDPATASPQLRTALASALNSILQGPSIYEATLFLNVKLSPQTSSLSSQTLAGADLVRFNRLLLEDAYPAPQIVKRMMPPDMAWFSGDLSQPIKSLLVRLYKSVSLCNALKMSRADLSLTRKSLSDPYGFTVIDFNALPAVDGDVLPDVKGFEQLLALLQLRGLTSNAADLLRQYAAIDFSDAAAVTNAQRVLADGFAIDNSEVKKAADHLKIKSEQFRDPVALKRLIELLVSLKQLGATVDQVVPKDPVPADLTAPNGLTAASPSDADAGVARQLLRGKYGDLQWHDLIKPISDKLRERQRDALVDYLLNRDQLRNADDLYEHYLIDVQTGSCLTTTRLLQATGAVQLFVQRVLLNLEDGASLSDPHWRQVWDWMHQYRVWEANRKVFLFPENWLLPELRDDKTAIFKEMEGALTQQEQSVESTRDALLGYLEEFADLAQISVIAMYQEDTRAPAGPRPGLSTLYVVGRMPDQTSRYFLRSCENFGSTDTMSWSGWEALDLDNANDFIMPFVMEGDLHLAWPIFTKKVDQHDKNLLLWDVQLAWTRRTNKGWMKRKTGGVTLTGVKRLPVKDATASFVFRLSKTRSDGPKFGKKPIALEQINISCYAAKEAVVEDSLGYDSEPPPSNLAYSGDVRNSGQWNVGLRLHGAVYRYAVVGADKVTYSRPLKNPVTITLNYQRKDGDSGESPVSLPPLSTNPDGTFDIPLATPRGDGPIRDPRIGDPRNDGEGVFNGSAVNVQFDETPPASLLKSKTMVSEALGGGDTFFQNWDWEFYIAVKDSSLEGLFTADRAVNYEPTATFILESGSDLRFGEVPPAFDFNSSLPVVVVPFASAYNPTVTTLAVSMHVGGNRFLLTESSVSEIARSVDFSATIPTAFLAIGFPNSGLWSPPRTLKFPLGISVSPVTPDTYQAWYVQDSDGAFYVQNRDDGWHYWADGQPFASAYRTEAIVASTDLFQPDVQMCLHSDPSANNFNRLNAYANYDWELFLHVPLAIADYYAGQQRFEDARRWLHAVFDPTTTDMASGVPQFWRFHEFQNGADTIPSIATLLTWLAQKNADLPTKFSYQIQEWSANPFMPHLIARLRPSAYQWQTFFAYLDVLIGWGDQLFRRDTRESLIDATLLYVLAAKLLGPRPRVIPPPTPPYALTYRLLKGDPTGIDDFSNAWINYADLPGIKQIAGAQNGGPTSSVGTQSLTSLTALAFCVPQNDKVTEYYDTLENRLFNVRHCRNIDGVFRELPLYDPPIDPLLLIRAKAAGLDIDSVLGQLYAPLPNYRFSFTLQKAIELTTELKALGSALLAAMEKQDAEKLTLLRSTHEITLLKLVRDTRRKQIDEANANIDALQRSADTILERFGQYQKLLGKSGITKDQDGLPVLEQSSSLAVSTDPVGVGSGLGLIREEVEQFIWSANANAITQMANSVHVMEGIFAALPNVWAGDAFVAGQTFGGSNLASVSGATARAIEMLAAAANYQASQLGTLASYERRQDEWVHQSKMALAEFAQIQKQIVAAQIREAIAESELSNHETQISNAQDVDDFMRGKFTNQQLYGWMSSQIADVYFSAYQLALDQAQRAERAYQHELGPVTPTTPFIQTDNWDSLKRGLLAGEHLYQDLKRMESAYLERNVREFEITKHVSLLQLDPGALISLKAGRPDNDGKLQYECTFDVPEALYDLDYPGHYMRRIKMVSLSIPCVAGPYASVSATLQLNKSTIRIDSTGAYLRTDASDSRFTSTVAAVTAIVTSSGQQDSGMFDPNMRDERYLPFEGAGAVSNWSLTLPNDFRPFDYETISDIVLHIRYTARDGGDDLRKVCKGALNAALKKLKSRGDENNDVGLARLFSLRHEFPTEWNRLLGAPDAVGVQRQEFAITKNRFPFLFSGGSITLTISKVTMYNLPKPHAEKTDFPPSEIYLPNSSKVEHKSDAFINELKGKSFDAGVDVNCEDQYAKWKVEITDIAAFRTNVQDILMVCYYTV